MLQRQWARSPCGADGSVPRLVVGAMPWRAEGAIPRPCLGAMPLVCRTRRLPSGRSALGLTARTAVAMTSDTADNLSGGLDPSLYPGVKPPWRDHVSRQDDTGRPSALGPEVPM